MDEQEKRHQSELHDYKLREMKMAFEEQKRFTECRALEDEN